MKAGPEEKLTLMSVRIRRGFAIALALTLSLCAGAAMEHWVMTAGVPPDAMMEFALMSQAWRAIDRYYVDRGAVRSTAMAYGAISGMAESLGDTGHSVFLTPQQAKKADSAMQGKLNGVGIEIRARDHQTVVIAPMDGSPAEMAGVRAGDVIMEVDGRPITGLSFGQIAERISGQIGQTVELTVQNPNDGHTRSIKIVRAAIKVNNVSWQRLPGTQLAHLRIAMFSEGESDDLRKALLDIQRESLKGIILDLRNDPGGILDEAVATASQFLKSGNVLWEKDAKSKISAVPVKTGGVATDVPLVVLINSGSASDSEIVAGALRDAHRATLVGETTFGTGTVLSEFELSDGSSLLLAVQEWLTPDKRSFWHKGIEPDVKIGLEKKLSPLLPNAERDMSEYQVKTAGDTQLLKAIEILEDQTKRGF
jgi:carboxyl-terminal processing protease